MENSNEKSDLVSELIKIYLKNKSSNSLNEDLIKFFKEILSKENFDKAMNTFLEKKEERKLKYLYKQKFNEIQIGQKITGKIIDSKKNIDNFSVKYIRLDLGSNIIATLDKSKIKLLNFLSQGDELIIKVVDKNDFEKKLKIKFIKIVKFIEIVNIDLFSNGDTKENSESFPKIYNFTHKNREGLNINNNYDYIYDLYIK